MEKEFRENAKAETDSTQKCVEQIIANLNEANSWYKKLGKLGRDFTKAAQALDLQEKVDTTLPMTAGYAPYGYPTGFINEILYGQAATGNAATLFFTKTHETIHGLQTHKVLATHMTPCNPETTFILCPRDMVWLDELAEHDAYAKHTWICHSLKDKYADLDKALYDTPTSLSAFDDVLKVNRFDDKDTALKKALQQTGQDAMNSVKHMKDSENISLRSYYHLTTLNDYYRVCAARQEQNPEEQIQIVRLDDEDIIALGNSFGPNFFTDKKGELLDQYRKFAGFDSEMAASNCATLNNMLGITNENDLPTLGETLAKQGITKEFFMEYSMQKDLPLSVQNAPTFKAA